MHCKLAKNVVCYDEVKEEEGRSEIQEVQVDLGRGWAAKTTRLAVLAWSVHLQLSIRYSSSLYDRVANASLFPIRASLKRINTNRYFSDSEIMSTPDIGKLDLSDSNSDNEDLFASPSRPSKSTQKLPTKPADNNVPNQRNGESKYDTEQAREATLQRELESVRSINEVIEGVVSSLETAKGNMNVRHFKSPTLLPWHRC